jgi:O-antigen ligase
MAGPGRTPLGACVEGELELPYTAHDDAPVRLLQVFAGALMVFPSDSVVAAVGAAGFMASLVAMALFAMYLAAVALGHHDPRLRRSPIRVTLAAMWCVSLVSYALMHLREMPELEALSADRWLLLLAAMTGVILVAAEGLSTLGDIRRVVRVLVWGGAFCGLVAGLQFYLNLDVAAMVRMLPGFTASEEYSSIISRGALNRVAGTALHPIELGVVAGMLLPVAIYMGVHDLKRPRWRRWTPTVLILASSTVSVSRSAVLALVIALAVLLALLPPRHRLVGLILLPFGLIGVFMTTPGLITTLSSFFAAGQNDPSVATRVDDYPMVVALVTERPWFGQGGATFFPETALEILDNQYLKTAVELGLVGVAALTLYLALPFFLALSARRRATDPEMRMLCAGLAAALAPATICPLTFDAFSFPMFTLLHALLVGLTGACWAVVRTEQSLLVAAPPRDVALRQCHQPTSHWGEL